MTERNVLAMQESSSVDGCHPVRWAFRAGFGNLEKPHRKVTGILKVTSIGVM